MGVVDTFLSLAVDSNSNVSPDHILTRELHMLLTVQMQYILLLSHMGCLRNAPP
jgi:hypothetical protein